MGGSSRSLIKKYNIVSLIFFLHTPCGILLTIVLHDSDSRDVREDLLMYIIRDWQLGLTKNIEGTVFFLRLFGMT